MYEPYPLTPNLKIPDTQKNTDIQRKEKIFRIDIYIGHPKNSWI